jgi:Holliday junction resolvasome RuvABC endonuclease subunit
MIRNRKQTAILTNDPSITAWGWAIITTEDGLVKECGCIKTESKASVLRIRKGDDRVRRISELNIRLLEVIRRYNIALIVSELPHGSQSAVAAVMIGIVTGIVQTLGDSLGIPVEWYSEGDAKKSIIGKKAISKTEMIQKIKSMYGVHFTGIKYRDEAVADAMAVYHVAYNTSPIVKWLVNTE